jgi:hypothetical protein
VPSDKFSFLLPGVEEEEEEGPGLWGYMDEPTIRQFPFRQLFIYYLHKLSLNLPSPPASS